MREIGKERVAKWLLLCLLLAFLLMPLLDFFRYGNLGMWSPLFYIDFLAINIGAYYGFAAIALALVSLVGWFLLRGGYKAGRVILMVIYAPAVVVYLILTFYILLTLFFKNRHNTFTIELLDYLVKLLLASAVLVLQRIWRGKEI